MPKNLWSRIVPFSLLAFISIFLLVSRRAAASWLIDSNGNLIRVSGGSVLGKDSEGSGGSGESSGGSSGGDHGSSGGGSPAPAPTPAPVPSSSTVTGESSPEVKVEAKNNFPENKVQAEIRRGGAQVKIEREGSKFELKVESENGEEVQKVDPEGEDLLKIDQRNDDNEIHIASEGAEPEHLLVTHRRVGAQTSLPISIDLKTNQLVVTTQSGSRVVAVLPDQAIQNLLRNQLLDEVGNSTINEILNQSSPSSALASAVELRQDDLGQPVYEVRGFKNKKVLGVVPVTLPRTTIVSAQTGAVESVNESLLVRLLSLISL